MNENQGGDPCSLCGSEATSRDSALYLYCRDCESVSAIFPDPDRSEVGSMSGEEDEIALWATTRDVTHADAD
jgi:hypothetical protein